MYNRLYQYFTENKILYLKILFRAYNLIIKSIIRSLIIFKKPRNFLRNTLRSVIPANNTWKIIYTRTKLASKFNIKDKISKEHKHDLIYKAQCPDLNCDETYIGEIRRRFSERIIDHSGRDDKPHLYGHGEKTGHENVNIDHFQILSNGYKNNKFKIKLAEALHIKPFVSAVNCSHKKPRLRCL